METLQIQIKKVNNFSELAALNRGDVVDVCLSHGRDIEKMIFYEVRKLERNNVAGLLVRSYKLSNIPKDCPIAEWHVLEKYMSFNDGRVYFDHTNSVLPISRISNEYRLMNELLVHAGL